MNLKDMSADALEQLERERAAQLAATAKLEEAEKWPAYEQIGIKLDRLGVETSPINAGSVSTTISLPKVPYITVPENAPPEFCARLKALQDRVDAQRCALRERAVRELRDGPYQEWVARRQAERDEYAALYARLPQPLRDRDAAGYAAPGEVGAAIRRLIRRDAGYPGYAGWWRSSVLTALTDGEFARLQTIRATAPAGAKIETLEVWDGGWRQATEDDDPSAVNADGEIELPRENVRHVAVIQWRRAGVTAKAVLPL